MKKFILGFIVGAAIMIPVTALGQTAYQKVEAYLNPEIKVSVEGEYVSLESAPIVYQQRTYLPVRELVENVMGNEVNWVQETTTVEITNPDIWPINDVSEGGEDVSSELDQELTEEELRKKESFRQSLNQRYAEFFDYDQELNVDQLSDLLRRLDILIRMENEFLEAEKKSEDKTYFPPHLTEEVHIILERALEAKSYWETLKSQKEAEQSQEEVEQ